LAVLDWELSTLGHPLVDFAYHAMMYRMPPDIVAGLEGCDLIALNIPSEREYAADYCRNVKIEFIPDYDFYLAFNFFRLAAIFHGIRGRVARGTAASADARRRAESFPTLAALAWAQARHISDIAIKVKNMVSSEKSSPNLWHSKSRDCLARKRNNTTSKAKTVPGI